MFEAPDLTDFDQRGLRYTALAENADTVANWRKVEELVGEIRFNTPETAAFVKTSTTYGRIKYAIVEQACRILFIGRDAASSGNFDHEALKDALRQYDTLWDEWRTLEKSHPESATIHKDTGFEGKPGLGAAVTRCRKLLD